MSRIEKLIEFLQESPGDSFLQHALALEYIKIEEGKKAQELFEKILEKEPDYVGSYYHLGKLLEKKGETEYALNTYEKGMAIAKAKNDKHSYSELQAAKEDLEE